ncbi:MAG: nucleoside-diphosphate sugar epimerase [Alphaproteobacteria bacterium]|nr:nucleoside-diphosphate sugar epimerase [Alphaproteobacteria bacterium]
MPTAAITLWAVTEGRVGDDRQVLALADAIGATVTAIRRRPSLGRVVLDRIGDGAGLRRRPDASAPWPDLIVIVGGRNVSFARRVKAASGGRARIVLVGRPWFAPLDAFDLVVTTPQYGLPGAANVIQNTLPLNAIDAGAMATEGGRWRERFAGLPRPWIGVLVGGPNRTCTIDGGGLAARAEALARESGGSLLVSTSRRTPASLADAVLHGMAPGYRYRWRADDGDNPHGGILALADRFLVTGESASMIAEAVSTGRPVALFPVTFRPLARLLARLPRWGDLVRRGLWVPARDVRRLHAALAWRGDNELERTAARVRMLIGRVSAPDTPVEPSSP